MKTKGFTLVELLIYLAIFGVISGLFIGILGVAARVKEREMGANEVTTQLNFVTQTIQRLIRESSAAIVNCALNESIKDNDVAENECSVGPGTSLISTAQPVLRLRMKEPAKDPTIIWTENGKVRMQQGTQPAADLTTNRVTVPVSGLEFKKFSKADNNVWHDVIEIQFTLNYNSLNPAAQFSQKLPSAVGRASAATFDDSLLPGASATPLPAIGSSISPWENAYIKNLNVTGGVNGGLKESNYDGVTGGFKVIGAAGAIPEFSCVDVCQGHGLSCAAYYELDATPTLVSPCQRIIHPSSFCFCKFP